MELLREYFGRKREGEVKNEWLYILRCEENKWYIGKSGNLSQRLEEHFYDQNGSAWTSKYKPIQLMEIKTVDGEFHEDLIVKEYMKKYGIENVRGGSYSSITLVDYQLRALNSEMIHASNSCFKCGRLGHMARGCPINPDRCYRCNEIGHIAKKCIKMGSPPMKRMRPNDETLICYKCQGKGHLADQCLQKYV